MAKNKLKRFEENKLFKHVLQPPRSEMLRGFGVKGKWRELIFRNNNPITLELGCGKGEYVLALAKRYPNRNFIGIDIKGARIWKGAKEVECLELNNIVFLRTQIELLTYAFGENEVDEIWITFPDPQIKFRRAKHRLTHPIFLERYKEFLKPTGLIHLKTDSEFLHGYTLGVLENLDMEVLLSNHDIYLESTHDLPNEVTSIQTHYESLFLSENKPITYLKFRFNSN